MQKGGNVGGCCIVCHGLTGDLRLRHVVGTRALPFCRRDVEFVALDRQGGWIPFGWYPGYGFGLRLASDESEDRDRIGTGVGGKEPFAVLRNGDRIRHCSKISLPGKP